jgi:hypothetical protein
VVLALRIWVRIMESRDSVRVVGAISADRSGISGSLLDSSGRIDRVVLRGGEWPRGLCQFRLALRLAAAYADDESATAGDQGRRGR